MKLQKKVVTEGWTKKVLERAYTGPNSWGPTYHEHKQHLEFSEEQFQELQEFAKEMDIPLFATPFDEVCNIVFTITTFALKLFYHSCE